jgi:hypothetical protein
MKNITVCVDDETYRQARARAAEQGTSVSALVQRFLVRLASGESEGDQLKREEIRLRESIVSFHASGRVARDELHARRV